MANTIDSSLLQNIGVSGQPQPQKADEIGQAQFLKLMTTQLQNQDPFKPMENGEFLSQIAQFGTVNGIQDLQKSFEQFSSSLIPSQGLQAASLINRNVLVPADTMTLGSNGMSGAVELDLPASSVNVSIYTPTGTLVNSFSLGSQQAGLTKYTWDGSLADGSQAAPGRYKVVVDARVQGKNIGAKNFANAPVDSITFGGQGTELNLNIRGIGSRSFSEIVQIS